MRRRLSILEERAVNILEHHKIFDFVREYQFHPSRKWRLDIAFPDKKLGIELEGVFGLAVLTIRGVHYASDCEKYNQPTLLGWKVLRYTERNIYPYLPVDLIALGILKE